MDEFFFVYEICACSQSMRRYKKISSSICYVNKNYESLVLLKTPHDECIYNDLSSYCDDEASPCFNLVSK
ncbi:hypothetical protein KIN20_025446 [Parelaphostrongylus tenuis]|uniref:Uncharacterized protein n=1 Tax=Parelaphostrongylus tenuis TaxID=148309 RepID=A0AAD5MZI0_PARTN|nr:hypothetical protein KIN20_025446 [Parelaphostrongylus tenuis]